MRLLPRSKTGTRVAGGLAQRRRTPASVVTSWLRQGLRMGICPLCRVAHKADREYIWHFFDEGADSGEQIDTVSAAYGFCGEHMEMLRRLEMEGLGSTLALSTMLADSFRGIVTQLDELVPEQPFEPARCPACANREERLQLNARYLLDQLASSPGHRSKFESSPGLCFPHFRLVWEAAQPSSDREFLLEV